MMIGIGLGGFIILYFVIKGAVKAGINESMLFTHKERWDQAQKEADELNVLVEEVRTKKDER